MKLVNDWRQAVRWRSMQVLALIAAVPVLYEALPPEAIALVPDHWRPWIITGLAVCGMIGRVVKQRAADE